MSVSNPLVSIIMPVFNGEKYISQAINSVLLQSYPHWELLIINDGSDDNSEQVVVSFQDKRIRYFAQENKGVSSARNTGLSSMKGDFFCFLDADDEFTPQSLEARINLFSRNEEVNFVDGFVYITGKDKNDIKKIWKSRYNFINPQQHLAKINDKIFVTISWMFRRLPQTQYQFKKGMTHAEDLWFFIEYSSSGLYAHVDQPTMYFRRTGVSAMGNLDGLEAGYLQLYKMMKKNIHRFHYNEFDLFITRFKLMKIMFLSFISKMSLTKSLYTIVKFIRV